MINDERVQAHGISYHALVVQTLWISSMHCLGLHRFSLDAEGGTAVVSGVCCPWLRGPFAPPLRSWLAPRWLAMGVVLGSMSADVSMRSPRVIHSHRVTHPYRVRTPPSGRNGGGLAKIGTWEVDDGRQGQLLPFKGCELWPCRE